MWFRRNLVPWLWDLHLEAAIFLVEMLRARDSWPADDKIYQVYWGQGDGQELRRSVSHPLR